MGIDGTENITGDDVAEDVNSRLTDAPDPAAPSGVSNKVQRERDNANAEEERRQAAREDTDFQREVHREQQSEADAKAAEGITWDAPSSKESSDEEESDQS